MPVYLVTCWFPPVLKSSHSLSPTLACPYAHLLHSPSPTIHHAGIKLVLNSRVASVGDGVVNVVDKQNVKSEIRFGACVWATGIAMNPLVKMMQKQIPEQNHFRQVITSVRPGTLRSASAGAVLPHIAHCVGTPAPSALSIPPTHLFLTLP